MEEEIIEKEPKHGEQSRITAARDARQYHNDTESSYSLPNDAREHARLENQAACLVDVMDGKVFLAPLNPSETTCVLDVGCGTGAVTKALAAAFPLARCYGLDLSPTPTGKEPILPNVQFLQGNILTQKPTQWVAGSGELALAENALLFDHVFSRLLVLGIDDWTKYIHNAYQLLKPGGWVEVQDLDMVFHDDQGCAQTTGTVAWLPVVCELLIRKNLDPYCGSNTYQKMIDAGFQDVQSFEYMNCWGSETPYLSEAYRALARFNESDQVAMLEGMVQKVCEGELPQERVDELVGMVQTSLKPEVFRYIPYIVTIGQKPE